MGLFLALLLTLMSLRTAMRLPAHGDGLQDWTLIMHTIMVNAWQDQKSLELLPSWPENRSQRFPSASERVKLYLGPTWSHLVEDDECNQTSPNKKLWSYEYQQQGSVVVLSPLQVSNGEDDGQNSTTALPVSSIFTISNEAALGIKQALFVRIPQIQACADGPNKPTRYCRDVMQTVVPAMNHTHKNHNGPPIFMRFGDVLQPHTPYPLFQKFRPVLHKHHFPLCGNDAASFQWPMIWKLNTERHYAVLDQVASQDIYWRYKKNQAIFRGDLSGGLVPTVASANDVQAMTERCQQSTRCRFVYDHFENPLINAKLIALRRGLNATINGRTIKGHRKSLSEMLRYKGLIVLEGNDVASGLKWGLLSRSVVLMPPPTKTSWCMEESLEPWIHYVPLEPDGRDAQTKMQWVMDHDAQAQTIAHHGSLWMQDLMASDADGTIFETLLQAYCGAFFAPPD